MSTFPPVTFDFPDGWPELVWVQPDGYTAYVSSPRFDMATLDRRQRAYLRATVSMVTERLSALAYDEMAAPLPLTPQYPAEEGK